MMIENVRKDHTFKWRTLIRIVFAGLVMLVALMSDHAV